MPAHFFSAVWPLALAIFVMAGIIVSAAAAVALAAAIRRARKSAKRRQEQAAGEEEDLDPSIRSEMKASVGQGSRPYESHVVVETVSADGIHYFPNL